MADQPLVIDVVPDWGQATDADLLVLVEPLYGGPAVAAALDAGWGSVEIGPERRDAAPIPLVSFEQPPPVEQRGGRCRVRCDDLWGALDDAASEWETVLLGTPVLARPLASRLAVEAIGRIAFVPAPSFRDPGEPTMCSDAWWASGMLVRVLLDELDARASELTDGAGIAVTLAQGGEPAAAMLGIGQRWRAHLQRGGSSDDVRVAAAVDSIGVIPSVDLRDEDSFIARAWLPDAYSGS